ncbi:hypothetical protein H0I31_01680 [Tenacibaculum sp. AHE15PA]|uniref:hypothetical protein n=1 Tax=Tenacibaculum TaxID=104267 RepID=UPI001C4E78E9|nr:MULTISPECIES: hypothetical protein [Tenacibaculum]QXP72438.1 hypothetical protein H0I30_06935 [Tenacibaculum sp. AHE14PA]QXP76354.1 hypothetical protein H0I31_01680 [Tenacibaculum sp. AHE15PA]
MKTLKFLLTAVFFIFFASLQQVNAQNEIKLLKSQVEDKKDQIDANEEVLVSGVRALKRVTANLEDFKKGKNTTKEEIKRKEKIVSSMQSRLTRLNAQIDMQKDDLAAIERKLERKTRKSSPKVAKVVTEKTVVNNSVNNTVSELALRKKQLEDARLKLENDRKAKEIAYLKQQESLRLEAEKLKQLDNQIKAEEKSIVKEKGTLISDYEDDISINEEILTSGKEGLARMNAKLEKAKKDPSTSKESIARKEAIIVKIKDRLIKIQEEINAKKLELNKLKG